MGRTFSAGACPSVVRRRTGRLLRAKIFRFPLEAFRHKIGSLRRCHCHPPMPPAPCSRPFDVFALKDCLSAMNPSALPARSTESEIAKPEPAEPEKPSSVLATRSIYNRVFWMAYAANVSLVMANALTFRFAEFVSWLGGSEQTAGTIVSVGIFGRFWFGSCWGKPSTITEPASFGFWGVSFTSPVPACFWECPIWAGQFTWPVWGLRRGLPRCLPARWSISKTWFPPTAEPKSSGIWEAAGSWG